MYILRHNVNYYLNYLCMNEQLKTHLFGRGGETSTARCRGRPLSPNWTMPQTRRCRGGCLMMCGNDQMTTIDELAREVSCCLAGRPQDSDARRRAGSDAREGPMAVGGPQRLWRTRPAAAGEYAYARAGPGLATY